MHDAYGPARAVWWSNTDSHGFPVRSFRLLLVTILVSLSYWVPLYGRERASGGPDEDVAAPAQTDPVEIGISGAIRPENPLQAAAEARRPLHVHTLWESRYVSEGRDNLDGDPLASAATDITFGNLTFAPWVAHGYETDYTEVNLNLVYGWSLSEQLELYGGYNHLEIRTDGDWDKDNELSAGLIYAPTTLFDILVGCYHSFEAHGSFWEWGLQREHTINEQTMLTLNGVVGANDGYIVDGHNGLNHVQLRLDLAYYPAPYLEIVPYAAYNIAIDREPDRYPDDHLLRDFFWGGIGIIYHF